MVAQHEYRCGRKRHQSCAAATFAVALLLAPPTSAAPTVHPTHHLVFPDAENVLSAVVAPDGRHVYVHLHESALDLWAVAVHLWPELLGGAAALLALPLAVMLVRVRRRPQRPGLPHCRRCNYDLSAHGTLTGRRGRRAFEAPAATRCPECGADPHRRRPCRGRSARRRLAVPAALALVPLGGYGAMHAAGLPRSGAARWWYSWLSFGLAGPAADLKWPWLDRCITWGDSIAEVSVASGEITRTVYRGDSGYSAPAISPDGRWLYCTASGLSREGYGRGWIVQIDLRTGRRARGARLPAAPDATHRGSAILGFWDGGGTVLVQCVGRHQPRAYVVAWTPRTGRQEVLFNTPARLRPMYGREYVHSRSILLWPGAAGPRFVSVPQPELVTSGPGEPYDVRIGEGEGGGGRTVTLGTMHPSAGAPVITPDGAAMLLIGQVRGGVTWLDLASGEHEDRLAGQGALRDLRLSADGRVLVAKDAGGVMVYDLAASRRLASLHVPASLYGATPAVCADGGVVAAVCQTNSGANGGRKGFEHEVLVYDLREIVTGDPAAAGEGSR